MREEILSMIHRCQNRIRGLNTETDLTAVGQRMAYNRVIAELKLLLEKCEEEEA